MLFSKSDLFVMPPADVYTSEQYQYGQGHHTYTSYNYLGDGLIPRLKRSRFEVALALVRDRFGKADAIDFGCADGVFIPSLARYFPRVTAVDESEDSIRVAQHLVRRLDLDNVQLICNRGLSIDALRQELPKPAGVLFLLETLEHVGEAARLYESKMEFLGSLFTLLDPDGVIVISIPKMVGLPFLVKYAVQNALGMHHERMDMRSILRAGLLKDTEALEPQWTGGHMGFNNAKLERELARTFEVVRKRDLGFSEFYVVRRWASRTA